MNNENHCNTECKFFKNEHLCKAIQNDQNCYTCAVSSNTITKREAKRYRELYKREQITTNELRAKITELNKIILKTESECGGK